ncbi:MAG: hypothetical protein FJX18_07275 [Alphaproteobacteria bacterium]|nr:hypothetical protein [Alphaproteobacteria bacterium]
MHFKAATTELESSIRAGAVSPNIFSETQLQAIMKGSPKIPGYTWYHDLGKIQLIPEVVHNHPLMRHVGGFSMGVK